MNDFNPQALLGRVDSLSHLGIGGSSLTTWLVHRFGLFSGGNVSGFVAATAGTN